MIVSPLMTLRSLSKVCAAAAAAASLTVFQSICLSICLPIGPTRRCKPSIRRLRRPHRRRRCRCRETGCPETLLEEKNWQQRKRDKYEGDCIRRSRQFIEPFLDAVADDSGLYTCIAWGENGETRRSASLKVLHGELGNCPFRIRPLRPSIGPSFIRLFVCLFPVRSLRGSEIQIRYIEAAAFGGSLLNSIFRLGVRGSSKETPTCRHAGRRSLFFTNTFQLKSPRASLDEAVRRFESGPLAHRQSASVGER